MAVLASCLVLVLVTRGSDDGRTYKTREKTKTQRHTEKENLPLLSLLMIPLYMFRGFGSVEC